MAKSAAPRKKATAKNYAEKRNFTLTPEPQFEEKQLAAQSKLTFVIQRHDATRLHFDFRLECDGALKSWAVPKGPSLDPHVRRAAIMVEDHPIGYANFEGQIPKGQYGGGEVLIWDEGTYAPEDATGDPKKDEALVRKGLQEGKLNFVMFGHRLHGGFVLIRTGRDNQWLLIKRTDEYATTEDPTQDATSIRTGRTSEDVKAGRHAGQMKEALGHAPGAVKGPMPASPSPMLLVEVEKAFTNEEWTFEVKLDGIRVMLVKEDGKARIVSRNGNDITARFRSVAKAFEEIPATQFVLDGELVLLDAEGKPTFQGLMDSYHGERSGGDPILFVFDILHLGEYDLRRCALRDRRKLLEGLPLSGPIKLLDTTPTEGELLYDQALKLGFEGVVAKRLDSPYREGVRSHDWEKVKSYHSEEFLVGGYSKGTGNREKTLGALLLGRYDEDGSLKYVGNVGGGLSSEQLDEMREDLDKLKIAKSPFVNPVAVRGKPTFVKPERVVEVRFMNWTRDGKLRFPIFLRTRPDVEEGVMPQKEKKPDSILDQLGAKEDEIELEVEGQKISVSSLDKELWPDITKRELLRYSVRVAPFLLPYLQDRPLTFVRYPDGIDGEGFFQRHWEKGLPDFVDTIMIWSDSNEKPRRFLICNNLPTLLWLGQMATLELHPWHSRVAAGEDKKPTKFDTAADLAESALEYPDYMVCDLDPNIRSGKEKEGDEPELNEEGWRRTCQVALEVKEILEGLGLRGYVKSTGKTGLHIFIPLAREYTNDQVKEAARTLGRHVMNEHPDEITMELRLAKRPNKVFFDANMNGFGRTLACAYSPRPKIGGRVSMPLTWDRIGKVHPDEFTMFTVPDLLDRNGDLWANFLDDRQKLLG